MNLRLAIRRTLTRNRAVCGADPDGVLSPCESVGQRMNRGTLTPRCSIVRLIFGCGVVVGGAIAGAAPNQGSGSPAPANAGIACRNGKVNVSSTQSGASCSGDARTHSVTCGIDAGNGLTKELSSGHCDADGNAVCDYSTAGSPCSVSITAAPPSNTASPPTVLAPPAPASAPTTPKPIITLPALKK